MNDHEKPTADALKRHAARYSRNFTGLQQLKVQYRPHICPFADLLEYMPRHASLLDIGCGAGLLLYLHGKVNAPAVLSGLDVDAGQQERVAKFLSSELPGVEINLWATTSPADWPEQQHDVVSMVDVMHHIPVAEQLDFLKQAARRVAPGGKFVYKDMCGESLFYATTNRIHDLVVAREWARYLPLKTVTEELTKLGFIKLAMSQKVLYWYGHETLVLENSVC